MFVRVNYKLYIGNPGGGCYTVCPVNITEPKDHWHDVLDYNYEQMFSFYDDPFMFLLPLLKKHFDKNISYENIRDIYSKIEFDEYSDNLYTYDTWDKLLKDLNALKKNYPKLPDDREKFTYEQRHEYEFIDLFTMTCKRIMREYPDADYINVSGP